MEVQARAFRTPGSKIWTVDVTGPGVNEVTQAKRLVDVKDMTRSVVALTHGVPEGSVLVTVVVSETDDVLADWSDAAQATEAAREALMEAAARSRAVARSARDTYGAGDAAFILGISKQRMSQLTSE